MPFNIAFVPINEAPVWFVIDTIIDFLFITDIIINFFSAYQDDEGNLITENRKIARKYLKSWFFIDIISSVPLNLILITTVTEDSNSSNYN